MKTRIILALLACLSLSLMACAPVAFNSKTVEKTIPDEQPVTQKQQTVDQTEPTTTTSSVEKVLLGDKYKPTGRWCFNAVRKICLHDIQWEHYGASSARATAQFQYCPPSAQESPCGSGQATLGASEVGTMCGAQHFTYMRFKTSGGELEFNYAPEGSGSCEFRTGDDFAKLLVMDGSPSNKSSQANSQVKDCGQSAQQGYVYLQNVRNWSCSAALRDLQRSESVMAGARPFQSPAGFSCGAVTTNSQKLDQYTAMRCVSGSKAYRFSVKVY